MTTKIRLTRQSTPAREAARPGTAPCKPGIAHTHMRWIGFARAWVAMASALALVLAGLVAPAAMAAEPGGAESPAAEEPCKAAAEHSAEINKRLFPLSGHAQGRASRAHKRKHKAHHHAKHMMRRAVVTVDGWRVIISDSIDSYTMMVLIQGEAASNCLLGPNPSEPPAGVDTGSPGPQSVTVGANDIGGFALGLTRARDSKPFSYIEGRAGSTVSAVRFTLKDGRHVSAKLLNGWFLAMWEGGGHVVAIEVVSAAGVSNRHFHDPSDNEG